METKTRCYINSTNWKTFLENERTVNDSRQCVRRNVDLLSNFNSFIYLGQGSLLTKPSLSVFWNARGEIFGKKNIVQWIAAYTEAVEQTAPKGLLDIFRSKLKLVSSDENQFQKHYMLSIWSQLIQTVLKSPTEFPLILETVIFKYHSDCFCKTREEITEFTLFIPPSLLLYFSVKTYWATKQNTIK